MFTGVPNMAYVFGYFRSSWTLRADLVSEFVCRLLGHMAARRARRSSSRRCAPRTPTCRCGPWADPENFNPGYVMRSMHLMLKQGDREPWTHLHEYVEERRRCRPPTSTTGRWSTAEPLPDRENPPRQSPPENQELFVPVDPHIAAVLTMLDEAGLPPMYEGSPEAGRALYLQLTHGARTPEQLVPVASTEDRTVPGADGRPEGPGLPAGGRRPLPDRRLLPRRRLGHRRPRHPRQHLPRTSADGSGAVVVARRLPPGARAPVPGRGRRRGGRRRAGWPSTAAEFGGDPTGSPSAGDSAGGNLAAVVAQLAATPAARRLPPSS